MTIVKEKFYWKQWAAVRTHCSLIKTPPQKWNPLSPRETCQPQSPGTASFPLMILFWFANGLSPHPARLAANALMARQATTNKRNIILIFFISFLKKTWNRTFCMNIYNQSWINVSFSHHLNCEHCSLFTLWNSERCLFEISALIIVNIMLVLLFNDKDSWICCGSWLRQISFICLKSK